jgi:hypothetical protein
MSRFDGGPPDGVLTQIDVEFRDDETGDDTMLARGQFFDNLSVDKLEQTLPVGGEYYEVFELFNCREVWLDNHQSGSLYNVTLSVLQPCA